MLTLAQVANELRVHVPTIRRWIKTGRLRAVQVGQREFVRPLELERVRALIQQGEILRRLRVEGNLS